LSHKGPESAKGAAEETVSESGPAEMATKFQKPKNGLKGGMGKGQGRTGRIKGDAQDMLVQMSGARQKSKKDAKTEKGFRRTKQKRPAKPSAKVPIGDTYRNLPKKPRKRNTIIHDKAPPTNREIPLRTKGLPAQVRAKKLGLNF